MITPESSIKTEKLILPTDDDLFLEVQVKKLLLAEGSGTTSHGIPNIIRSQDVKAKILWAIFFIVSFTYCMYTIINGVLIYYKYETYMTFSVERKNLVDFPAVTICNANPFNAKKETNDFIDGILEDMGLGQAKRIVDKDFSRKISFNSGASDTLMTTTPAPISVGFVAIESQGVTEKGMKTTSRIQEIYFI
jgi:hypothetical protein